MCMYVCAGTGADVSGAGAGAGTKAGAGAYAGSGPDAGVGDDDTELLQPGLGADAAGGGGRGFFGCGNRGVSGRRVRQCSTGSMALVLTFLTLTSPTISLA